MQKLAMLYHSRFGISKQISVKKVIYILCMYIWGISIKTKERLEKRDGEGIKFGVVVTLKEISGVNRIDEFIILKKAIDCNPFFYFFAEFCVLRDIAPGIVINPGRGFCYDRSSKSCLEGAAACRSRESISEIGWYWKNG